MHTSKLRYFILLGLIVGPIILLTGCCRNDKEYFGEFSGEPSLKLKEHDTGRPTFLLLEELRFKDPNGLVWTTPEGWEVDGASIPQAAWSFVGGPMSGRYVKASIIHDRYCDTKSRTAHDTHRNFYYGMLANGVPVSKAEAMYFAVRTFGPNWKITKIAVSSGDAGPKKYKLEAVPVSAPVVPKETIVKLMKKVESDIKLSEKKDKPINKVALDKSISKLELRSDAIRSKYGFEALQRSMPRLKPAEIMENRGAVHIEREPVTSN